MSDPSPTLPPHVRLRVWIALGLIACVPADCGEQIVHPCLSPIHEPDDPPLQPPEVTPCLSPVPIDDGRHCLSEIHPDPDPPTPEADPGAQGHLDSLDEVRERLFAEGRLPPDLIVRLQRRG